MNDRFLTDIDMLETSIIMTVPSNTPTNTLISVQERAQLCISHITISVIVSIISVLHD